MSDRPHIALVTYNITDWFADEENRLIAQTLGPDITSETLPWDVSTNWRRFDAVVVRTTWDYHNRLGVFLSWLSGLETQRVPVINTARTIRWNTDKRYLRELAAQGHRIVPTQWYRQDDAAPLDAALSALGWREAVLKPVVSASGENTVRFALGDAHALQPAFETMLRHGPVMLQRYMSEIETDGEWSLVCFDGVYSHAVQKHPAQGEFRVQEHYGGTSVPATPDSGLVAAAEAVVRSAADIVGEMPLYARVDGVCHQGQLHVMELELIEPSLYLWLPELAEAGLAALRAALLRRLRG